MVEEWFWTSQGLNQGEVNKRHTNNTWLHIVSVDTGVNIPHLLVPLKAPDLIAQQYNITIKTETGVLSDIFKAS